MQSAGEHVGIQRAGSGHVCPLETGIVDFRRWNRARTVTKTRRIVPHRFVPAISATEGKENHIRPEQGHWLQDQSWHTICPVPNSYPS